MRKQNQKWFHNFHTEDLPFPAWKTMEDQHFCGHRKAPLHPLPFRSFAPKAPGKAPSATLQPGVLPTQSGWPYNFEPKEPMNHLVPLILNIATISCSSAKNFLRPDGNLPCLGNSPVVGAIYIYVCLYVCLYVTYTYIYIHLCIYIYTHPYLMVKSPNRSQAPKVIGQYYARHSWRQVHPRDKSALTTPEEPIL